MRVSKNLSSGLYTIETYQVSEQLFPSVLKMHFVFDTLAHFLMLLSFHCIFPVFPVGLKKLSTLSTLMVSSLIRENDDLKFLLDHY